EAIAQMLSVTLYSRRFFPWYTFNVVCGIGRDGVAKLWSYDAVGNHTLANRAAQGSAGICALAALDGVFNGPNPPQTKETLVEAAKAAMMAASEVNITTGDTLELFALANNGEVQVLNVPLRSD